MNYKKYQVFLDGKKEIRGNYPCYNLLKRLEKKFILVSNFDSNIGGYYYPNRVYANQIGVMTISVHNNRAITKIIDYVGDVKGYVEENIEGLTLEEIK